MIGDADGGDGDDADDDGVDVVVHVWGGCLCLICGCMGGLC